MEQEQQWKRWNGQPVNVPIAEEVNRVLMQERTAGYELKVCIGTDSQVKGRMTEFATVIVFIRKGKGGFMYVNKETSRQRMTIKERMLKEGRSCRARSCP